MDWKSQGDTGIFAGSGDFWTAASEQAAGVTRLGVTVEDLRDAAWESASRLVELNDRVRQWLRTENLGALMDWRGTRATFDVIMCITTLALVTTILGEDWEFPLEQYPLLDDMMGDW